MEQKRKISKRKIWQTITTLVLLCGIGAAIQATQAHKRVVLLNGVDISLLNAQDAAFHSEETIRKILDMQHDFSVGKTKLENINLKLIESKLKADPWIAHAHAFVDHNGIVHVEATQRVPLVRIFQNDGQSFYIDSTLKHIPTSLEYAAYLPVVTNLPRLTNDSLSNDTKAQIIYLAQEMSKNDFWNAQVSEVVWQTGNQFTLIPNVGQHVVAIGDTSNLEQKFNNVLKFYKKILNKVGWDRYTLIDARFDGQIVASPALPWKRPADRAFLTMNWVESVVGKDTLNQNFQVDDTPPTLIAADIDLVMPSVTVNGMPSSFSTIEEKMEPLTEEPNDISQKLQQASATVEVPVVVEPKKTNHTAPTNTVVKTTQSVKQVAPINKETKKETPQVVKAVKKDTVKTQKTITKTTDGNQSKSTTTVKKTETPKPQSSKVEKPTEAKAVKKKEPSEPKVENKKPKENTKENQTPKYILD